MNRLTGDIVLEIRSFLDHESFYRWILACHVVTLDSDDDGSSLMKSGRPMIHKWLSKYVDFPIEKIQFGGTQGYLQSLKTNPILLRKNQNCSTATSLPCEYTSCTIHGPHYFLDFMSDHHDPKWNSRNDFWIGSSVKENKWFEEVIPDSCGPVCREKWFEEGAKYSYWTKLWDAEEKILSDAIIHCKHFGINCIKQYPLLVGLQRSGCMEFPPHDRMFAIPSALEPTCLDHDDQNDRTKSFTNESTADHTLANSLTVLDMLTDEGRGSRWSYWGNRVPHWELSRNKSGQLKWRWSLREPPQLANRDGNVQTTQEKRPKNDGVQSGYIPWCGSSEVSKETRAQWKLLQSSVCRWIDNRLEEFGHDDELTKAIVENLVDSYEMTNIFPMDDGLDDDGEALIAHLVAVESEASRWEESKAMRPADVNQRVQKIKTLAKEGLVRWKQYFGGPQDVLTSTSITATKGQDFATWQSIGLSDRRRLRFDPVKFNQWMTEAITWNLGGTASPSATSLLQFAAEDLGLGLTWRIEGANGKVAVILLGPHGSIWAKQEDRTILRHLAVSDDDESYCSGDSQSWYCRDDPNQQSAEQPVDNEQNLTTSETAKLASTQNDFQQMLLGRIEAIESTLKLEIDDLKATNATLNEEAANLKATNKDLKAEIEQVNSNLKQEIIERRAAEENHDLEIEILKLDLHQTRLDLAKAKHELASCKQPVQHEEGWP